jgi:DNA-binding MarR family transcriptional regulator
MRKKTHSNTIIKTNKHPLLNKAYGLDYKINDLILYSTNNKFMRKCIEKASLISGVKVSTLLYIIITIGKSSKDFCTLAGQKYLAEKASMSVKTIQRAIGSLRKAGVLYIIHRYKGEGLTRRRTTSCTILTAFIDYCRMNKDNKTRRQNDINILFDKAGVSVKKIIDTSTGELFDYIPINKYDSHINRPFYVGLHEHCY